MKALNEILSSLNRKGKSLGSVVGVDIGSSAIKVVELQERKGVITLATYGEVQLGPYVEQAVGESVTLEAKQEQEALVDILRESAVQARQAVFAMPLSSSFVTNVSITASTETELQSMVRVEARKVIPLALTEVALDWAEVHFSDKKTTKAKTVSDNRDILIVAIQNVALERFKVLMQFAGMKQPPTEIECFSAIRAVYKSEEPVVAIIDVGAVSSKLYISNQGLLARMYRVRAGGAIATKKIADTLKIDFEKAEELKCSADSTAEYYEELRRVHYESYDRTFREFNQVIREYESGSGTSIKLVYLTGGGAEFPGMHSYVKDVLNREVLLTNPFSKVAYPAFMEDSLKKIGPSFTVALGAALRELY